MKLDFSGKNVLVTGGGRGIGRSIVEAFAAAGANVAFTDISEDLVKEMAADLKADGVTALAIQGDASKLDSAVDTIEQVVAEWGSVDVLVNNVGITREPSSTVGIRVFLSIFEPATTPSSLRPRGGCGPKCRTLHRSRGRVPRRPHLPDRQVASGVHY
jgi:NAD(P)-dependent dehydrogenase (short-subunit alcohol dehydrogenase family)